MPYSARYGAGLLIFALLLLLGHTAQCFPCVRWAAELASPAPVRVTPTELSSFFPPQALQHISITTFLDGFMILELSCTTEINQTSIEKSLSKMRDAKFVTSYWLQTPLLRYPRSFNDPYYPLQGWYVRVLGLSSLWSEQITGRGIRLACIDDGVEPTHPELKSSYRADTSYDFNAGNIEPNPNASSSEGIFQHGTAVAGVAVAAANNHHCGVGIAYAAELSAIRLTAAPYDDFTEASALSYRTDRNDVYICSWGPRDDGATIDRPGPIARAALAAAVRDGRNGRGVVYVWAAGNGGENRDNCNFDGYANSRFVIAVSALDGTATAYAPYSERCAALLVAAPAGATAARGLVSADTTAGGYNRGSECIGNFIGTSAACPLVAGVVALMLSEYPQLGWRDVQHVLLHTADKIAPHDPDWMVNAAGYSVNYKYGFGRVNARCAIDYTREWKKNGTTPLGPQWVWASGVLNAAVEVSTSVDAEVVVELNDTNTTPDIKAERIEVIVDMETSQYRDVEIVLVSPSGTPCVLAEGMGSTNPRATLQSEPYGLVNWTFTTTFLWGEPINGTWRLKLRYHAHNYSDWLNATEYEPRALLHSWQLVVYASERRVLPPTEDRHVHEQPAGDYKITTLDIVAFVTLIVAVITVIVFAIVLRSYSRQRTSKNTPP